MKLNARDRLLAISNNPDYIADFENIKTQFEHKEKKRNIAKINTLTEKLCAKWQIISPVIPSLIDPNDITVKACLLLRPILKFDEMRVLSDFLEPRKDMTMKLVIDITSSETELVREFRKQLKGRLAKSKAPRKTLYDPWEILNLCRKYDNKISKVAKIMLAKEKAVTKTATENNAYKKVQSAYKRAQAMIEAVTPATTFP